MVLRGLCSRSNTVDPLLRNQRLELRRVDQTFRDYLVSTRRSKPCIPDPSAVPRMEFRITQRRSRQRVMNFAIGLHKPVQFGTDGRADMTLNLGNNRVAEIGVGVVSLNQHFAGVSGLTHKWSWGVSMDALSDAVLYSGSDAPGLLRKVRGFDDGEVQMNLAMMLVDAGKYGAARLLLDDIATKFPDLKPRCERTADRWNDRVGERVIGELNHLRDTGRYQLANSYARRWPDAKLDAVIRVRARQFIENADAEEQQLQNIRQSLQNDLAQIEDEEVLRQAKQIWMELKGELDLNSLPRFATYELLAQGSDMAAESRFALAATGWMLGPDGATDVFLQAAGIFQIRYLVRDYLATTDIDDAIRAEIISEIRGQEGFSIERVAALVRHLSPESSPSLIEAVENRSPLVIRSGDNETRSLALLPAEYRATRRYPLLIAFPRGGMTAEATAAWWQPHTEKHGYILMVPELYDAESGYGASAKQHREMLALLRNVKTELSIDDDRVFVAGHGIGGEAAMDVATSHPELFAGVLSIASLGRRHIQWTAHNSGDLPWYIVIGTRQPYYYKRMELLLRKLFQRVPIRGRSVFCDVVLARYAERGFESYAEELPNAFEWMSFQRRAGLPDHIEASIVRSTDRSWFWLELDDIPDRFVSLDEPNTYDDRPERKGVVSAEMRNNVFRIRQIPSTGTLRLSPDIPRFDPAEPVKVQFGSRLRSVEYQPSTWDLLEDYRTRRDRSRLCYMKVPLRK